MNPLIKKTVEKISGHITLTKSEKMVVAVEVGYAIMEALCAAKDNPNFNMKGGDSVDENTIGNFEVSIINEEKRGLKWGEIPHLKRLVFPKNYKFPPLHFNR